MPIDLDSDAWQDAETNDAIKAEIYNLFRNNKQKAFSVKEIEKHLLEEYPGLFPIDLVGPEAIDGAKAARQSIVTNILFNRYWNSEFTFRYVTDESNSEPGLYFADDGIGISPVAEIDEVKDPDPDSPFGTLESRFRKIEKDIDNNSDLEDRISRLEYRVREELGMW